MGAASRTAREFCTVCGWPVHGPRCDACGEYRAPLALEDSMRRFVPRGHAALDPSNLERATEAFRRGEYARALGLVVSAETNLTARAVNLPEGPGWALIGKESSVFLSLDMQSMHLIAESPVARLPRSQRVPAMRLSLELCDAEAMTSRVCLRDDLLLLRFVTQLGAAPPPLVRHVIREMMATSERYAEIFVASFDARTAAHGDARGGGGWESLGRKRSLSTLQPAPQRRSVVPPPPSTLRPADNASPPDDDLPPILAPAFAADASRGPVAEEELPPVLAPFGLTDTLRGEDGMPPVLAPSPEGVPQTARLGVPQTSAFAAPPPIDREPPPETARLGAIPSLTTPMPFASPGARRRTVPGMPAVEGAARPGSPDLDDAAARRALTPADKLCELLHQAQALATALSYEERPLTMLLLVRAAVYRAIYEFGEQVPDAVSYLYRSASGVTRTFWPSEPVGGKRSSSPIPMAEPVLLAMERIVAARAALPKERAFLVEPLATAAQAREHLARYVEEIELAPQDVTLRHFLALGALTELLSRTRLPQQTSQRLKEIVAHAHRDVPKQAALELMMTALKRIASG
ncbi:hypothetical protein [Polyangium spumosum]|uniref:Uncharacterized protein n=1 Tax=Polyangium spumosum TaxID=889282 RepID=A0A6N7Q539_9BACT|nr:hypothetical protein [Polyangium spumosum]MRG97384.1 hypothetical protein [Polyangium spumosum]